MTPRPALGPAATGALLSALCGWVALISWHGLVEDPHRFLGPALAGGLLVAATGALSRWRGWGWYAVLPAQLVVAALYLMHHAVSGEAGTAGWWSSWVPTPAHLADAGSLLQQGSDALSHQFSPVPASFPGTHLALAAASLGLLIAMDLLALGLGRGPLAGLPLLVIWMVPISLLSAHVDPVVFVVTAMLFVLLLSGEEVSRVLRWGRAVTDRSQRTGGRLRDSLDQGATGEAVRSSALRIGLVTCLAALVVPLFVPLLDNPLLRGIGNGTGAGNGRSVTIENPLVDLRRDLVRQSRTPLLAASTSAIDPSYLRLTVLDSFDGATWKPSRRSLPASHRAGTTLPRVPGLRPGSPGQRVDWQLDLLPSFSTAWLPVPYPVRSLSAVDGDWRYDERTLDFAEARGEPRSGPLSYSATEFRPDLSAVTLNNAFVAPPEVRDPMTRLPAQMPPVIARTARQIVGNAKTDYLKAVALQDWFRRTGGFRYSTARAPGSGLEQLAHFITDDKIGYCEQFAAAMATMARTLDIPARVAVGFLRPSTATDQRVIFTSDDLHAWPELYFSGLGWVRFEPTPGTRTGPAPAYTQGQLPTAAPPTASKAPDEVAPKPTRSTTTPQAAGSGGDSGSGVLVWVMSAVVALALLGLLAAVPALVRRSRRRRWLGATEDPRVLADGLWSELEATAIDLGIPWPAGRSPRELGRSLVRRLRPEAPLLRDLEELVQFVERARYARPFTVSASQATALQAALHRWTGALATSVPASRSRRARVLPRSVRPAARRTPPAESRTGSATERELVR